MKLGTCVLPGSVIGYLILWAGQKRMRFQQELVKPGGHTLGRRLSLFPELYGNFFS